MSAYRRCAWKRHVPDDSDLVAEHEQCEQVVERHIPRRAGMEANRNAVAGGDDFSQSFQADTLRMRGYEFDDFPSVNGDGGCDGWLGHGDGMLGNSRIPKIKIYRYENASIIRHLTRGKRKSTRKLCMFAVPVLFSGPAAPPIITQTARGCGSARDVFF